MTHMQSERCYPKRIQGGRFCSVTVTTLLSVTLPASRLWSVRHTRGITLTLTSIISENTTFDHRMNQAPHLHPSNLAAPITPASRKRMRENETPSQRTKREKAAERQRRKRERDRQAGLNSSSIQTGDQQAPISTVSVPDLHQQDMSPEEISRRDRVRAAARERQRKHRALVKQRKMRELGLDPMGNELIPGMEEVQYRVHPDSQYAVLPPELQHPPPPPPHGMPEPPFPQGQIHGGQTFASTLLLSFSCTPLLKQHLLRTLSMTNEELTSLEPIIAQAWDHWDQQVCTANSPPPSFTQGRVMADSPCL